MFIETCEMLNQSHEQMMRVLESSELPDADSTLFSSHEKELFRKFSEYVQLFTTRNFNKSNREATVKVMN